MGDSWSFDNPAENLSPDVREKFSLSDSDIHEIYDVMERVLLKKVAPHERMDVVQESMIFLMKRIAAGTGIDNIKGYAATVALNTAASHHRSRSRGGVSTVLADFTLEQIVMVDGRDGLEFVELEQHMDLMRLVSDFDHETRQSLAMLLDGYEISHIAEVLGVPRQAVYRKLSRVANAWRVADVKRTSLPHGANAVRALASAFEVGRIIGQFAVESGDLEYPKRVAVMFARAGLGKRQLEVLEMSAEGLKPRHIANRLGIDSNAVRASKSIALRIIRSKTGLGNEEILRKIGEISADPEARVAS